MWSNNAIVSSAAFMIETCRNDDALGNSRLVPNTETQELKHCDTKNLRLLLAAVYLVNTQQQRLDKIEHDLIRTCSYHSIISTIRYLLTSKKQESRRKLWRQNMAPILCCQKLQARSRKTWEYCTNPKMFTSQVRARIRRPASCKCDQLINFMPRSWGNEKHEHFEENERNCY